MKEFPITNSADQQFGVVLNDRRVTIRIRYNPTTDRWSFDLSIDDLPVLYGRRIVIGTDLLKAFDFGIGVLFALPSVDGSLPDRSSLPAGLVRVYSATEAEVEEASATVS